MSKEGDLSLNHLKRISSKIDAILFLGDMAYNLDYDEGRKGNKFLEYITPVTSLAPFMVNLLIIKLSVGNHEKYNNFEHYKKRFYMPNHEKTENLYYSYDINNIHIVSMNSEIFFNTDAFDDEYKDKVIKWLKEDLESSKHQWKIVYMHRPYYCSYKSKKKRCTIQSNIIKKGIEDIIQKNRVDVFLTGHNHYYERTLPVYKMEVDKKSLSENDSLYTNPKYTTYVTCGISGTDAYMPSQSCNYLFIF